MALLKFTVTGGFIYADSSDVKSLTRSSTGFNSSAEINGNAITGITAVQVVNPADGSVSTVA